MARTEERSAGARFPLAKEDDVNGLGVQRIAVTGASQSFVFPQAWKGKFLYFAFRANGEALTYGQVAVSVGAVTLELDQVSNAAAGSSSAAAGLTIEAGEALDRLAIDGADRVTWIGDAAAGYAEFYVSE